MQIALEIHWVFFLLLSHLQISTDCHSYSISLANYEFKFTFFGLLSQAEESEFSIPKLEGIQREISQLWNMLVYGLFLYFLKFSLLMM